MTGQKLVWDPAVNVDACAITVTANDPLGYNTTQYVTTFTRYYGYVWVQVQKLTTSNGQLTMQPAAVETDIVIAC